MINRFPSLLVCALILCAAAFGADVTGKWTAQIPARGGEMREATITLKAAGEKLTGTMSTQQGERAIADGKVSGDTISFTVETQRGKQTFTGTVAGDEIKFKRESAQGPAREFTAKRAK